MKKYLPIITTTFLCLGLLSAFAQMGRGPGGPKFDGAMTKLFGDNSAFSAAMEFQSSRNAGGPITMPGTIAFDAGKSRFEMNLSEAKGMKMPPEAAAHMKSMGMDMMISISRPDQKLAFIVYPGLHSFVQMPLPDASASTDGSDYKVETTELGKETFDGHDCVKNKVVVSDKDGNRHESTVWNATDLKKFPVKIVVNDQGQEVTMVFRKVSFEKPDASNFAAPADFTKYDNMQTMMQTEMMKKMSGGLGKPPGQ